MSVQISKSKLGLVRFATREPWATFIMLTVWVIQSHRYVLCACSRVCDALMEDFPIITLQEFANPRVRPHLHFYPEDAGQELGESWQAKRWLHELDPALTTPMIRIGTRDFYNYEPAQLMDRTVCMPVRWFLREERQGDRLISRFFAQAWRLQPAIFEGTFQGYIVNEWDTFEVDACHLALNFPQMVATFEIDRLPDPRNILGMCYSYLATIPRSVDTTLGVCKDASGGVFPWTYSKNPAEGNDWRTKAKGSKVVSFLLWLYCDDTSGNLSKKWNKLNSFLWTPAGLPRFMSQRQYNVHFLTTSNKAPLLEMLDGIVEQLEYVLCFSEGSLVVDENECPCREGQQDGIWAYDIVEKERVLVVPAVLALLGDNPMQSELSCHVGLAGKFFCRCCWVKGRDAEDEAAGVPGGSTPAPDTASRASTSTMAGSTNSSESGHNAPSLTASSAASADSDSPAVPPPTSGKKKGRPQETKQQLVERATRFLGVSIFCSGL